MDVRGDQNRSAAADYVEVRQIAGGNIHNYLMPHPREYLSSAQRTALNSLVMDVATECGIEARQLWREVVHARVGVESVKQIRRDQFALAEQALVVFRDDHRCRQGMFDLISRITSLTTERGLGSERDRFLLRQFGERRLDALSLDQLRQALVFVEDFGLPPRESFVISMQSAVTKYPAAFFLSFFLGVLIGRIL